jgi:hypothetical protein
MGMFDFNPAIETPQMLAERRLRAQYVANRIGGGAPSIGSGVGDIFRGLSSGLSNYLTDQNQMAGNAYGQSAVDTLNGLLSTPTSNPGTMAPPSNNTASAGIKSSITSGQTPQLATYIPPPPGSGAPTGQIINGNQPQPPIDPTVANPIPQPMAPKVTPAADVGDGTDATDTPDAPQTPPQAAPMAPANLYAAKISKVMEALRNPWVSDADKEYLKTRLAQIQKQSDPEYMQKMQMGDVQLQLARKNLADANAPDAPTIVTDPNSGNSYAYDASNPSAPWKLVHTADPAALDSNANSTAQIKNYKFMKEHPDFSTMLLGAPPKGFQWGPENADGTKTLIPIEGGDKTPGKMADPAYKDLVTSMSNYEVAPPSAGRNPAYRNKVLEDIRSINPSYDETVFDGKKAQERAFASGKIGDTTRSLGVTISHLGVLAELGQALKTGNVQMINAAKQNWQAQFGSQAPTDYQFAKSIVADEVAKSVIGGQNAQSDRETLAANLKASNSPEQMQGVITTAQKLMAGQLGGLRQQYNSYHPGANNFDQRFLSDDTTAALRKFHGGAQTQTPSGMPTIGEVRKGYRYKGGDPSQQSSWEAAQ